MRSIKREIIEEIFVALYVVMVTLLLWRWPMVLTALIVAGSAAMFVLWHGRADIIAYFAAAMIGFLADYLCTKANFYAFSVADMLKLPSWGPICWGYLYVLFMRGASTLHRILNEGWLGRHNIVKRILLSLVQIIIVIYLWKTVTVVNRYLAATLSVALVVSARFWNKERDLCAFLVAGLSGAIAEASAIHIGIWTYPSYFFIDPVKLPISIPLVYGVIGILVYRVSTVSLRRLKR